LIYRKGEGPTFLSDFEIEQANATILNAWQPQHDIALFVPCSWAKPYSQSFVHFSIRRELLIAGLLDRVDYIHISSIGVVPYDVEDWYPFCAYDWNNANVRNPWTFRALQISMLARLIKFMQRFQGAWRKSLFYFREGSHTIEVVRGLPPDILTEKTHFLGQVPTSKIEIVPIHPLASDDFWTEIELLVGYREPDAVLTCDQAMDQLFNALKEALG
jgi:hypothetical protein